MDPRPQTFELYDDPWSQIGASTWNLTERDSIAQAAVQAVDAVLNDTVGSVSNSNSNSNSSSSSPRGYGADSAHLFSKLDEPAFYRREQSTDNFGLCLQSTGG